MLDTNILVSAALTPGGAPARILEMVSDGALDLCASPEILSEYREVLARKKFGLSSATAMAIVERLHGLATIVEPSRRLFRCGDPGDDKFLDCAAACGADYLVTGNTRHFPKSLRGLSTVSPRRFLDLLGRHGTR